MAETESLTVRIYCPEEEVFSGTARAVFLPSVLGPFEVLRRHGAIISVLEKGPIRIIAGDGQEKVFPVKGGFAKVKDNIVTVCVER